MHKPSFLCGNHSGWRLDKKNFRRFLDFSLQQEVMGFRLKKNAEWGELSLYDPHHLRISTLLVLQFTKIRSELEWLRNFFIQEKAKILHENKLFSWKSVQSLEICILLFYFLQKSQKKCIEMANESSLLEWDV